MERCRDVEIFVGFYKKISCMEKRIGMGVIHTCIPQFSATAPIQKSSAEDQPAFFTAKDAT